MLEKFEKLSKMDEEALTCMDVVKCIYNLTDTDMLILDELSSQKFRRSLFVVQDVEPGESFTERNLRVIRPGDGLHPRYCETVLGRAAKTQIARGTPLSWDLVG